ncbi:MAG: primosomal protein N' [Chloroflexi bacterium]|nr:primosomal protein N' [Chloroflexota bacterium]
MRYAEIVVNTPLANPRTHGGAPAEQTPAQASRARTFSYSIPEPLVNQLAAGQLVWVPFGSRRLQGVVVGLADSAPVEQVKPIEELVDPQPFLSAMQIDLARWISETYLCPLYGALQMMLPPGIEQEPEILIALQRTATDGLTPSQRALVELVEREGEQKLAALAPELRAAAESLARRGIVVKRTVVAPPRARPKRVRAVRLVNADALSALKLREAQRSRLQAIVQFLRGEPGPVWISAAYAATEATPADLKKLAAAGVVELEAEEVWRDSLAERTFDIVEPPKLTPEQQAVWDQIAPGIRAAPAEPASPTPSGPPAAFLLHGVTGSGKTEIYMRALAEAIARGKQGIVLVPEIALTPQTLRRFGARFERIAVLHSRLGLGERYDTWRRCRDGQVDVVIGSRSALFAPVPRLGLIAVDEEHDAAYKQESAPHYHAREVALELARRTGATVILGSATPDVESYHRAKRGELRLVELPKRIMGHRGVIENEVTNFALRSANLAVRELSADYADALYLELPPVQVVDLRAELKAGNRSIFSRALQRELARVLNAHEQSILFLNRRGTATFILCRDCGYVWKCRRCDNPMTYHGVGDQLVCHHCNRRDRIPTQCPQCGSARIRYFGAGTQKIEQEIQTAFPKARTLRWDWDVTRGRESHEAILEQFVRHQADILIGTQMIAKGLDLPLVTLVGVVSADTSLNLPDFRAGERTFQLLTQVAGRAGRSILGGRVIIQTYNPENYAVAAASRHDYAAFYEREIAFRREQKYPPFARLVRLTYAHSSDKHAQEEAERVRQMLAMRCAQLGLPALDVIGPAPAFFHRVRGQYRFQILLRGREPHALISDIALPLGWRVDVDPATVL